jgi:hypothetical protein
MHPSARLPQSLDVGKPWYCLLGQHSMANLLEAVKKEAAFSLDLGWLPMTPSFSH